MQIVPTLNFGGNCREALHMYEKAFHGKINCLITYGQADDPAYDPLLKENQKEYIYHSELVLGDQTLNVQVMVDRDTITSIELVNLSDAVTTMYPLLQPAFDSLSEQICEQQSLDNISYDTDSKYTSLVLLEAIRNSLEKAQP